MTIQHIMKKKLYTLILLALLCSATWAAKSEKPCVNKIEPVSWWIGMNNPELMLQCHGKSIGDATVEINYSGVTVTKTEAVENPNYLFVFLNIDPATKPGTFDIVFKKGKKSIAKCKYTLNERREGSRMRESFNSGDAMYLLMPDRFANGNPSNDNVKGYIQGVNRANLGERHGGDLQGVIDHLGYLEDLGVTALWITPIFDNNDTQYSYHHYAVGDYFNVDPRLGSNKDYRNLSDSCHSHSIKLILDVVPNHCGIVHYWIKDLPTQDWIHQWPTYTSSNYRMTAWTDPHASKSDIEVLEKGWFSGNMPDLNLENPLLFKYLSQVYIWWIEYGNVDGLRVDTYPYNDIHLASRFMKTFLDEYPNLHIVGECWVKSPLEIAYYQSGNNNKDGFDSNLQSVMDFVLKDKLHEAFNERDGWDNGMSKFYAHYAQDFAYPDVNMVMNFLDNHDIDRFSVSVKRDINKYKMGIAMLLTTRGYPQIYYGDEIMLDGIAGNYEGHRFDFPGGWKEDSRNAFTAEGRTNEENEVFNYMRTLLQFRKNSKALQYGKMTQFIPVDGIYVFSREAEGERVMMIFNNSNNSQLISLDRYKELFEGATSGTEVVTGKKIDFDLKLSMPAKTAYVIKIDN